MVFLEMAKRIAKIRYFEESLDNLFERGIIFGTYHRCIGQEATAVGINFNLDKNDYVISNHRNHGHYLSFSDDFVGLLRELMGHKKGVTGGRGGSQVIFGRNFISSGILGSTIPFATGIGLGLLKKGEKNMAVCFMGDGAFGAGVVYESLNMASLWSIPVLYVLECNNIAQSTDVDLITAGSFEDRFKSFGISTLSLKSTDVLEIYEKSKEIIEKIKEDCKPAAIIVEAPRLCAHSKGDDDRPNDYLNQLRLIDPLVILESQLDEFTSIKKEAYDEIQKLILTTINE
jgi:TPP-dependent pyruvate/acetoin dehydrogenase alpha subunit